jgi:hypothetical protein
MASRCGSSWCVVGLTIVACLLAASCGDPTGSTASPRAGTSTSEPPSAEQRLSDQMLSLGDLPYGWSIDRHGGVPGADPCGLSISTDAADGVEHDERYTSSADGLPALGEVLISLPTVAAARAFFVENANSGGCASLSALPLGASSPVASSASDAPVYSFLTATDEGVASRGSETATTADGRNTTVGIDRLLARRGRIVAFVFLAEPNDPDAHWSLFAQLADQAVDKITDRETTGQYVQADQLCQAALPLTPGATNVSYAGVTTYGALLGSPLSDTIPDGQSTRAFLAACSYTGQERPLIRVYVDSAGHRYEPPASL